MRKKMIYSRILSAVLAAAMVFTGSGMTVLAQETGEVSANAEEEDEELLPETGTDQAEEESGGSEENGIEKGKAAGEEAEEPESEDEETVTEDEESSEADTAEAAELIDAEDEEADALGEDSGTAFTLNYYAGDDAGALGVNIWNGGSISISGDTDTWPLSADWNGTVYTMEESDTVSGWYSIEISISNTNTGDGFTIYSYDSETDDTASTEIAFDPSWNNTTAYSQMASDTDATAYSVKDGLVYADTVVDEASVTYASDIMRETTLYVHCSTGTPYLVSEQGTLKAFTEDSVSAYTALTEDTDTTAAQEWGNWYSMAACTDESMSDWYELTFILGEYESGTICFDMETYADGSFTWKTKAVTGDESMDPDLMLQGKNYLDLDASVFAFTDSSVLDTSVTLGDLRSLMKESEDEDQAGAAYLAYTKGETAYSSASWSTFKTAYETAAAYLATVSSEADTYTSDEVTADHKALKDALEALAAQRIMYFYHDGMAEGTSLYAIFWNTAVVGPNGETTTVDMGGWNGAGYLLEAVDGCSGWYDIPILCSASAGTGCSGDGFDIVEASGTETVTMTASVGTISAWSNTTIYNRLCELGANESIAVRGWTGYDSLPVDADLSVLASLITEVETLSEDNYKEAGWKTLQEALTEAKAAAAKDVSELTDLEVQTAYNALYEAKESLVSVNENDINVAARTLDGDFITGADLSSYVSLKESGVDFKDENGNSLSDQEFFDYLYDGGTNWVRIRVWNDPYDSSGNGYGGGNSDIEKAVTIGKLATNAGMRVLIDFHYSDFWADPSKQEAPKAWSSMELEEKADAVSEFTTECLTTLKKAGVDVGMIQVGNETNNGICGESSWANMAVIYNAGSSAAKEFDDDILVAVHYTDPQNGFSTIAENLDENGVDYDVFATSYYPYWHGTTENLKASLGYVASTYDKQVMVAETSWATTWEDGDGHSNTAPKTAGQELNYDISVQGQADEISDVVGTISETTGGIGVFYWEPAWLSKYYAYNADGTVNSDNYKKNQQLWEKYGSGWASSYSYEYDPSDAGLWYGGSAIDNQAWFDFDGTALSTAKIYKLIRTGSTAALAISEVENHLSMTVETGDTIEWPTDLAVKFNDGNTNDSTDEDGHATTISIKWDKDSRAAVTTDRVGSYTVSGKATVTYSNGESDITENYDVTLDIDVISSINLLTNPGFEDNSKDGWDETCEEAYDGDTKADYDVKLINGSSNESRNIRSGSFAVNFYRNDEINYTISQTVEADDLNPGTYTFGGYVEGGSAGSDDLQTAFAVVYGEDGTQKAYYTSKVSLSGWLNWMNPEISDIVIEEGDYMTVGLNIRTSIAGAWGSFDDFYLYGTYPVTVEDVQNGTVSVSRTEAASGEKVTITANAADGYQLKELYFGGDGDITDVSCSEAGTFDEDLQKITYEDADSTETAVITMPAGGVMIGAEFGSLFESKIDIGDAVLAAIEDQYYTGSAIKPELVLTYKGYRLTESDYRAEWTNNTRISTEADESAGTEKSYASVKITAKGSRFTGTRTAEFRIIADDRTDLSKAVLTFTAPDKGKSSYYYTADYVCPEVKLALKDGTELDSSLYTVNYSSNKKVGKAVAVVTPEDDTLAKNSLTASFDIVKKPISELRISGKSFSTTYSGEKFTPNPVLYNGTEKLQLGTDYTLSFKNNVNVSSTDADGNSTAYMIITGKGNYTGKSDKLYLTIRAKSLKDSDVKAAAAALNAGGSAQTPKVTVTVNGKTLGSDQYKVTALVRNTDEGTEEIASCKAKEEGTYTATITGKKNYKDDITVEFKVVGKRYNLANAKITTVSKTYTGSAVTLDTEAGELKVKDASGTELTLGTDYTVKYENNLKAGKARITVSPADGSSYTGTKTANFTINKCRLSRQSDITWSRVLNSEGEEDVLYATGYEQKPEYTIRNSNGAALKAGTDYTLSYSGNVKPGTSMKITVNGKGNYTGKVSFAGPEIEDLKLSDLNVSIKAASYTGSAVKPEVVFTRRADGERVQLKAGTAYTIQFKNNTKAVGANADKAPYAVIKEKGLNASARSKDKQSITVKFSITAAEITENSISDIQVQTYKGKAVKPSLSVKVNGKSLKAGKDYIVSYTSNTSRGCATATVTGIGNYTGTASKTFLIK